MAVGAVALLALTRLRRRPTRRQPAARTPAGQGLRGKTPSSASPCRSKTSENWVLAGDLFTNGLKEAGFKSDVQYAGASTTVADQQAQITAMVTKGAKVIVIGATDAAQLSTQVAAGASRPARRSSRTTA